MALPQLKTSPIKKKSRQVNTKKNKRSVINYHFREFKRLEYLENKSRVKFFKSAIFSSIVASLLIGLCFFSFLTVNNQNLNLKEMKSQHESLKVKNDYIILELAPYTNSKYIEDVAKTSLGLDYPTADQYLYLERE